MKKPALAVPADCLLHIERLAAAPEPAAAADAGDYLRQLLAVGSVCRTWRAATLEAPFRRRHQLGAAALLCCPGGGGAWAS